MMRMAREQFMPVDGASPTSQGPLARAGSSCLLAPLYCEKALWIGLHSDCTPASAYALY
jgi:hypothetical protein